MMISAQLRFGTAASGCEFRARDEPAATARPPLDTAPGGVLDVRCGPEPGGVLDERCGPEPGGVLDERCGPTPGGVLDDRCAPLGRCCTVPGPLDERRGVVTSRSCGLLGVCERAGSKFDGRGWSGGSDGCAACGGIDIGDGRTATACACCDGGGRETAGADRDGAGFAACTTGSGTTFCVGASVPCRRAPQPPQNRESGSFWVLQLGQRIPQDRVTKSRVTRLNWARRDRPGRCDILGVWKRG
jgi:hypothetical protein